MKVVTATTMQQLDQRTISEFGIDGLTLMENAGRCCAELIEAEYGPLSRTIVVIAGKGNNGGDGYVIARILGEHGWKTRVIVLARREEIAGDARVNLDLLAPDRVTFATESSALLEEFKLMAEDVILVDAIFGTGLRNKATGLFVEAIEIINSTNNPVIAIDIPSGIDANNGLVLGSAIRANLTVTFALAKVGHVLYPGAEFTGKLIVVDIGIPAELTSGTDVFEFLDIDSISPMLRRRELQSHKGSNGHVFIVAGSTGKTGAAAMAANSAVRAGAGLVTLAIPASLNPILEIKTTEAMTLSLPDNGNGFFGGDCQSVLEQASRDKSVIAIGPGVGMHPVTSKLVRDFLGSVRSPLIIDADGLNAIAVDMNILIARQNSILIFTPHPGEMARLSGLSTAEVESDRLGVAKAFAQKYNVHLILKGSRTVIASPDGSLAINGSGNPGMATGGMGDVLTGVLAALIAQGYSPEHSCRIGVFLHGYAADIVSREKGEIGMSAVDVQECLPYALKEIMSFMHN